ncbi:VIT1/CCC1 transporter family protein [bacterium]|nr:VIT1/CCC1 transporter family protein [bacterium]
MHTAEAIAARVASRRENDYTGDFILGAIDGAITTFAIVAGAAGAGVSVGIATVFGIANVLADGLSMAASNYLKCRAEAENLEKFREMESRHIDRAPEAEKRELVEIFQQKGFEGELLDAIVEGIAEDREQWINTMLTEEWGLPLHPPNAFAAAGTTFSSFVAVGAIPLLPLLFVSREESTAVIFLVCSLVTLGTFFCIGAIRGVLAQSSSPLRSGLETFVIGGTAAGVAYGAGILLEGLA